MSCLCLGPKRAGKTHLLKALQDPGTIDETTYSEPTIGTNIFYVNFPKKSLDDTQRPKPAAPTTTTTTNDDENTNDGKKTVGKLLDFIKITEIGGTMAPLWRHYFTDVHKIIYVVDTSNLCQISAAGVLLYSILAEPRLQKVKILIVLTKMDYAYRQMRNEALLMMQMSKLKQQIRQSVTIVESSSVTKIGLDSIYDWLQRP